MSTSRPTACSEPSAVGDGFERRADLVAAVAHRAQTVGQERLAGRLKIVERGGAGLGQTVVGADGQALSHWTVIIGRDSERRPEA